MAEEKDREEPIEIKDKRHFARNGSVREDGRKEGEEEKTAPEDKPKERNPDRARNRSYRQWTFLPLSFL